MAVGGDPNVDLIFGQNTELDKQVEKSAVLYGGDPDTDISEIPPESLDTASDILVDLYKHSKMKLKRGDELDGFETLAGGFAQRIEGGDSLRPDDANQLYVIMSELGERMYDPAFAAEMGYKGIAQEKGQVQELDERWLAEVEKISKVKADIFRSMTGFDGSDSVGDYDHAALQWEIASRDTNKVIAYLVKGRIDETKTKDEHGRKVQAARLQEYADKKARYLPEQLLAAELARENQKKLDDLRKYVRTKDANGDPLFNGSVTDLVNNAKSWSEVEKTVAGLQNQDVQTKVAELKQRRTASEIREDLFFKPGVDATVERILARKAVSEPAALEKQKTKSEQRLKHLRTQKTPTKQEQQEIHNLEHQIGIIESAEGTFAEGGMSEFLSPSQEVSLASMEDRLPASAHTAFEDYIADRVGYNARPGDPNRQKQWRDGLNTKMKAQGKNKQTNFKMGMFFTGFLKMELQKVPNV